MVDTEDTKYILIRHIKGLYTTRIEGLAYMQKSSLIRKVGALLVFCLVHIERLSRYVDLFNVGVVSTRLYMLQYNSMCLARIGIVTELNQNCKKNQSTPG